MSTTRALNLVRWSVIFAVIINAINSEKIDPLHEHAKEAGKKVVIRQEEGHTFMDFMDEGSPRRYFNTTNRLRAQESGENEIVEPDVYPHCDKTPEERPDNRHPRDELTMERLKIQTRLLQLKAHKYAIYGPPENIHVPEPKNSFNILNLTLAVFLKLCPATAIPPDYTSYIHQLFRMLHNYMTPTRVEYLTTEETNWLSKLLQECEEQVQAQAFKLNGDCGDNIEGDGLGVKICTDPAHQFAPKKFDFLLDVIWRIYELVHFQCFARFQGYARVWHRFAMAIFDLYNLPLKQRWESPVYTDAELEMLYGPYYADISKNIDKCVHAYAMRDKVLKERLPRIWEAYSSRYGPNIEKIFQNETQAADQDGGSGSKAGTET